MNACQTCGVALPPAWELCEPCRQANMTCLDCGESISQGYARCMPCVIKAMLIGGRVPPQPPFMQEIANEAAQNARSQMD